jgi:hypothetical protein
MRVAFAEVIGHIRDSGKIYVNWWGWHHRENGEHTAQGYANACFHQQAKNGIAPSAFEIQQAVESENGYAAIAR